MSVWEKIKNFFTNFFTEEVEDDNVYDEGDKKEDFIDVPIGEEKTDEKED